MPMFEYTCRDCGQRFETLVIGRRKPACPKCNSENLEKQASTFAAGTTGSGGRLSWGGGGSCSTGGG